MFKKQKKHYYIPQQIVQVTKKIVLHCTRIFWFDAIYILTVIWPWLLIEMNVRCSRLSGIYTINFILITVPSLVTQRARKAFNLALSKHCIGRQVGISIIIHFFFIMKEDTHQTCWFETRIYTNIKMLKSFRCLLVWLKKSFSVRYSSYQIRLYIISLWRGKRSGLSRQSVAKTGDITSFESFLCECFVNGYSFTKTFSDEIAPLFHLICLSFKVGSE